MQTLNKYRSEKIDLELIKLLEQRMILSKKIGDYKKELGLPVYDPSREEELKNKYLAIVNEVFRSGYKEIFETILKVSKDIQL